MNEINNKLIDQINVFSSNSISRFVSKQKLTPFGGDRRKYKYRVSLLNSFVDLENIVENLEASILGTSGKSIFESIQYLSNAKRQLGKIKSIVKAYGIEFLSDSSLNNVDETRIKDNNIEEIIKDYEINKLNFSEEDSPFFSKLNDLISVYKSGDISISDKIKSMYNSLINDLSGGKPAISLEDILMNKIDKNNLESSAGISNFLKKWYGKLRHNTSIFDETSSVRLDVAEMVAESLELIQEVLALLENDLVPKDVLEYVSSLNINFTNINKLMDPLIKSIEGSSFGDEFIKMIEKNKLTDFPANLSDKDKKSFESYLRTREFKSLLNMYEGKE